ncbi:MAG TPA: HlyD family secretion protein [Stellaceae bacterium]|nr:HlyD family secretion protein [Stellaceae bacterium]
MAVAADTRAGSRRSTRLGWLRIALMLVVPLAIGFGAGYFYLLAGRYVSTDDAYVQADIVQISPDVGGRVVAVEVRDNEKVMPGQVLFRLDDRDYRIAVEAAKAELASARLRVDALRADYRQKLVELKQAQDTQAYEEREFTRQQQLLAEHVTSQQKFDEARHARDVARQQVGSTEQQIANTLAALGGNPDIVTADHPLVQRAQAALDRAELNLSYTVVRAPIEGIVSKVDKLPVGEYLNVATPAFPLVSTRHVWIESNFKETDLTHMHPGQEATVDIDAYPDKTFTAEVESIGAGTGSAFSVLPPQNATGNWVKVVQRIPVRLVITDPDPDRPLRAGMSADVEVDTHYRQPLLIKIDALLHRVTGMSAFATSK